MRSFIYTVSIVTALGFTYRPARAQTEVTIMGQQTIDAETLVPAMPQGAPRPNPVTAAELQLLTDPADPKARDMLERANAQAREILANVHGESPWERSTTQNRPLIIRSTETDAKTLAGIHEDLNVMARILDKAARGSSEPSAQPEAMGVPISFLPGASGARAMQIEGYGAIFQLSVNFPLKGPAEKPDEKPAKEPTNSTWEQTRRELYGQGPGAKPRVPRPAAPEFDPKRVEKLKDLLLDALKNGSNMKYVKSDEMVTVVVNSAGDSPAQTYRWAANSIGGTATAVPGDYDSVYDNRTGKTIRNFKNPDGTTTLRVFPAGEGSAESVMTLKVKKSDIDAFAAGKLTLDQFRSKAAWLLY